MLKVYRRKTDWRYDKYRVNKILHHSDPEFVCEVEVERATDMLKMLKTMFLNYHFYTSNY